MRHYSSNMRYIFWWLLAIFDWKWWFALWVVTYMLCTQQLAQIEIFTVGRSIDLMCMHWLRGIYSIYCISFEFMISHSSTYAWNEFDMIENIHFRTILTASQWWKHYWISMRWNYHLLPICLLDFQSRVRNIHSIAWLVVHTM